MAKVLQLFCIFTLACAFLVEAVYAQLVNYDRLQKRKETTVQTPPAEPLPFWKVKPPDVTNDVERRYDTNNDRILQSAEVKIFLRDVISEIEAKKSYNVNNAPSLLKPYDKNKDGIISRLEVEALKKDSRS